MTKLSRLVFFGMLMTALSAASAYALPTVTVVGFATGHTNGFNGGAFELNATGGFGTFNSFCIEKDEYITLPNKTYYYTLSPYADAGGVNTNATDPISLGTAYLYYQYSTGAFPTAIGVGSGAQQQALQEAFWFLEDELNWNASTKTNAYVLLAMSNLSSTFAQLQTNSGGAGGVKVMNLWATQDITGTKGSGYQQDQLVRVSVGTFSVPDGGTTLALLGLALGGMGMFSRRKKGVV